MKRKKITIIFVLLFSIALFYGCTKKEESKRAVPLIGIAKIVSHPSLDLIEKGIVDRFNERGIKADFDLQNANGDINTASSIANKFKSEKVDIAVGIATPIAVALANSITDKPVIFTGVTDPVGAYLVESMDNGYKNITGVVDTIPIAEQLKEFIKIYPIKKLGYIYTNSESNAVSMAEIAKKVCAELGIEFVPATITNSSEVNQAAESLIGRVDSFYVTTDNALVSGINALISTAAVKRLPVFSADIPSATEGGVLYAIGFNYYTIGEKTADLIIDVLNGKKPADIAVVSIKDPADYDTLIDMDIAKRLNINIDNETANKATLIIKDGKLINKSDSMD